MDEDTDELIILLSTRIGAIMEDASVVALTIGKLDASGRSEAIADLSQASRTINRLIRVVEVLNC